MTDRIAGREQTKLMWNGTICPCNDALIQAIGSHNKDLIFKHEQCFIMMLCATPNGCDIHFILQAVNAHHRGNQDPKRIMAHIRQLTETGIIERNQENRGKYRVKATAILKAEEILGDITKKAPVIV